MLNENLNKDTGFGDSASGMGGRMINKDGTFNVDRKGISFLTRISSYQSMLTMSRWKFVLVIILFYFLINLGFTFLYWLIGVEHFQGIESQNPVQQFFELYFFSTQTYTTVGYGRINPTGQMANWLASIESLVGFLSFALATGLLYGRFSRPKSFIYFSDKLLHCDFKNGKALMFRMVGFKDDHILTNVEVKVGIRLSVFDEQKNRSFQFYNLELERHHVDSLVLNWTVVHPINEESPLYNMNPQQIVDFQPEISATIIGFDEVYSSNVVARVSYAREDLIFGKKFKSMYFSKGNTTELDIGLLNDVD